MKKLLLIICFMFSAGLTHANMLIGVTSQVTNQIQNVSFNFDSSAVQPKIFIAGNDLILDFFNITTQNTKNQYIFDNGYTHEVDIVTVGKRTRIVIIGGAKYKYAINVQGAAASLVFSDQLPQGSVHKEQVGLFNLSKANNSKYSVIVNAIKFQRDDAAGGVVEIPYSGDNVLSFKDERVGNNIVLTLSAVGYNPALLKRIDTSDFDTPIKFIDTKGANNQLVITLINRNLWDYAIYQLQGKLIVNVRKIDKAQEGAIPNLNDSKAEKVSFNFQNIDVRSLLQLLADFSGYNILVSDSVNGTMSLKLNNVPWDQALQIILNAKGLGMRRDGNVIRVAPNAELDALSKLRQDSQKVQEATEPLDTATIRLKYAQASTIQSMLQQKGGSLSSANGASVISGANNSQPGPAMSNSLNAPSNTSMTLASGSNANSLLSPRGSILVDTRTNTLIINDTPSHLKEIRDLIDKIDIPVKQVLIEARIVEARSDFERNLGTRLLLAGVAGSTTYSNTLENGITINQQGMNSISASPSTYINQNLGMGIAPNSSISAIFAPNSDTLIGLEVDAQEAMNEGKTISSPKVVTANYQAANIQQGVQIPYQQASSAGNTNVAFVNATLELQVTPQITEDGYILLNIQVQKDTPSQTLQVQGTPAIDTNSVNTQVRVKDGSTILIGGIYVDAQAKVVEQVPLLGDIPYLGWLFKVQTITNNKQELLIFITPRIIATNLDNDT